MAANSNTTTAATMMRLYCLGLCYVISVLVSTVLGDCPSNAMRAAQLCTPGLPLRLQPGPNNFVAGGSVDIAERACNNGEGTKAMDCLQRLMDSCQGNTEGEQLLRMLVDTARMRIAVENFCSRLSAYKRHVPCIVSTQHDLVECAAETRRNFLTKIRATSNSDVMITSTCRFHHKAMSCSSTIIRERCGGEAADIVTDMLHGFQPPKCLELGEETYEVEKKQNDAPANNAGTRAASSDVILAVVPAITAVVASTVTSSL